MGLKWNTYENQMERAWIHEFKFFQHKLDFLRNINNVIMLNNTKTHAEQTVNLLKKVLDEQTISWVTNERLTEIKWCDSVTYGFNKLSISRATYDTLGWNL